MKPKICKCGHDIINHSRFDGACELCPCKKFEEDKSMIIDGSKLADEIEKAKKPQKGCGKMLRMSFDCGDIIDNKLMLCEDCKKPQIHSPTSAGELRDTPSDGHSLKEGTPDENSISGTGKDSSGTFTNLSDENNDSLAFFLGALGIKITDAIKIVEFVKEKDKTFIKKLKEKLCDKCHRNHIPENLRKSTTSLCGYCPETMDFKKIARRRNMYLKDIKKVFKEGRSYFAKCRTCEEIDKLAGEELK